MKVTTEPPKVRVPGFDGESKPEGPAGQPSPAASATGFFTRLLLQTCPHTVNGL